MVSFKILTHAKNLEKRFFAFKVHGRNKLISKEELASRSELHRKINLANNAHRTKTAHTIKKKLDRQSNIKRASFGSNIKVDPYFPPDSSKYLADKPPCSVFIKSLFPEKKYSLCEALEMHREFNQPDILDNEDGIVHVDFWLDASGRKQGKFMSPFSSTIIHKNQFDIAEKNRVIVLTKQEGDAGKCIEAGAKLAGGDKVLRKLIDKTVTKEDFDILICASNFIDNLSTNSSLRNYLGDLFPKTTNYTLGENCLDMTQNAINGYTFHTQEISGFSQLFARVQMGRLNMLNEKINENLKHFLSELQKQKSYQQLKKFILHSECLVLPSPEKFTLKLQFDGI